MSVAGQYDPSQDARTATALECYELFSQTRELALDFAARGQALYYVGSSPEKPSKYQGIWIPDMGDTLVADPLIVAQGPPTYHMRFTGLGRDLHEFVPQARTVLGLGELLTVKFRPAYLKCGDEDGTVPQGAKPERPDCYFGIPAAKQGALKARVYLVDDIGRQSGEGTRHDRPHEGGEDAQVPAQSPRAPHMMIGEHRALTQLVEALGVLRRTGKPERHY